MLISNFGALLLEDLNLLLLLLSSRAGSGRDSVFFRSTLYEKQETKIGTPKLTYFTYVGVVSARFLNNSRSLSKAGSILLYLLT